MFWGVKIEIRVLWEATLSKSNYRCACVFVLICLVIPFTLLLFVFIFCVFGFLGFFLPVWGYLWGGEKLDKIFWGLLKATPFKTMKIKLPMCYCRRQLPALPVADCGPHPGVEDHPKVFDCW